MLEIFLLLCLSNEKTYLFLLFKNLYFFQNKVSLFYHLLPFVCKHCGSPSSNHVLNPSNLKTATWINKIKIILSGESNILLTTWQMSLVQLCRTKKGAEIWYQILTSTPHRSIWAACWEKKIFFFHSSLSSSFLSLLGIVCLVCKSNGKSCYGFIAS